MLLDFIYLTLSFCNAKFVLESARDMQKPYSIISLMGVTSSQV